MRKSELPSSEENNDGGSGKMIKKTTKQKKKKNPKLIKKAKKVVKRAEDAMANIRNEGAQDDFDDWGESSSSEEENEEFFGPKKLPHRKAPSAKNPESHKLAPKNGPGHSKATGGGDAISPITPRRLEITIPPTQTTDSKRYYNDPAPKRAPFVERLTMSTMTGDPNEEEGGTTEAMAKRAAAPKG